MLRVVVVLFALMLLTLVGAEVAPGQAGGGSSDFGGGAGGGGGGGGGDFGSGGGSSGDGEGGSPLVLLAVGAVFVAFFLLRTARGRDLLASLLSAVRRKLRRKRVREVGLAAAEAAEDDERFSPQEVRSVAEELFRETQLAWDARDAARLAALLGSDLLVEWERRLADFDRKGWHSRAEVIGDVQFEYVGLSNREGESEDRVIVLIEAVLRAYVEDRGGRRIYRKGESDDTIRLSQYWTLGVREGRWILVSIEERSEGEHHLAEPITASPWSDTEHVRDEAVIEAAAADELPTGFKPADLADLDFDGDARAAALDLSLADPRFAPDVLEAAARQFVEAWAEAVDGDDTALAELAGEPALRRLLHRGDDSKKTRLVVRGLGVRRIAIVALDAAAEPATVTIEVQLSGRRYVEDRDTAAVLSGSRNEAMTFTERWTLSLDGSDSSPWRIAAVSDAGAEPAGSPGAGSG